MDGKAVPVVLEAMVVVLAIVITVRVMDVNLRYFLENSVIRKILVLIMLSGIFGQSQARESDTVNQSTKPKMDSEMTAEVKDIMRSVDEVKRLPVTGLSMIKAGDKTFLITDNGHFVVAGNLKLIDMWQGKVIGSVADTKGIDKVDLRKIGLILLCQIIWPIQKTELCV